MAPSAGLTADQSLSAGDRRWAAPKVRSPKLPAGTASGTLSTPALHGRHVSAPQPNRRGGRRAPGRGAQGGRRSRYARGPLAERTQLPTPRCLVLFRTAARTDARSSPVPCRAPTHPAASDRPQGFLRRTFRSSPAGQTDRIASRMCARLMNRDLRSAADLVAPPAPAPPLEMRCPVVVIKAGSGAVACGQGNRGLVINSRWPPRRARPRPL